MTGDLVRNKIASIERCLDRIRMELASGPAALDDQTQQDAIVLNLMRACESTIDLAMHVASRQGLGIPQETRDVFNLLHDSGVIDAGLRDRLQRMVGFRNLAVHEYQKLQRPILESIVTERLSDFTEFATAILNLADPR
jgi:uncharacterized protein YutE (UPF0331/DUF86 family)